MKQLNQKEAEHIYKNRLWEDWDSKTRFLFQVQQERLCMDFSAYHDAAHEALDRPVYNFEFAKPELLYDEYYKLRGKPSLKEIIEQLPQDKIVVLNKDLDKKID